MPGHHRIGIVLAIALCLRAELNEYQVKAFFLYNFARYVEWPVQSFKSPGEPIAICILGANPFGTALDQAIAGRDVGGRSFVVRQITGEDTPGGCRILFVNASERRRFRTLGPSLAGAGVLTVSDSQGFTAEGGVINFKLQDGKVRFEINLQAAEREHLHISSKLLSLAEIAGKERR